MWSCGRALGWGGRLGDPAEFRGREPDPSVAGLVNWYNSGPEGGFCRTDSNRLWRLLGRSDD